MAPEQLRGEDVDGRTDIFAFGAVLFETITGERAFPGTSALRDLPVVIQKETTSAMWHREAQVLAQNPDLIGSHLSCLLDERFGEPDTPLEEHLFGLAENRLVLFFGYVATVNPRTQFLVYSRRGVFRDSARAKQWREGVEARLPALRSRLHTFSVPGGPERATFRDPDTARLIRQPVARILGLPLGLRSASPPT